MKQSKKYDQSPQFNRKRDPRALPENFNLNPIILIPGIVGSKLITKSVADKRISEYAWVPQTVSISKFCSSVVKHFWGFYANGRFQSYLEYYNYAQTTAVSGINGCYRILDSKLTETWFAPIFHICYYFDYYIESLMNLGYVPGVNLFAFSYDWRQSPESEIN